EGIVVFLDTIVGVTGFGATLFRLAFDLHPAGGKQQPQHPADIDNHQNNNPPTPETAHDRSCSSPLACKSSLRGSLFLLCGSSSLPTGSSSAKGNWAASSKSFFLWPL